MSEVPDLLRLADSDNPKERKEAAKKMGQLDYQYDVVMDKLQILKNDNDRGVRKESDKAFKNLRKKPIMEADTTEAGESGTAFDSTVGDSSLEAGEIDVESSMTKREEDRMEAAAGGIGLQVMLVEEQKATLDTYGKLLEQDKPKGSISVMNNGARSRITGVDLKLTNTANVTSDESLNDQLNIGVIRPGDEWSRDYSFEGEFTPISVKQEYVDLETNVSPNFTGGDTKNFELRIDITNNMDVAITNVKGTKALNPAATVNAAGDATSNGDSLGFSFDEIGSGESRQLLVQMSAALGEDVTAYRAGELSVTYDVSDTLVSGIDFTGIDGGADIKQRVKRRQRETEPDTYDCEIIFENKSEFIIDISRFTVFAGNADSQAIVLDWLGDEATEDEREIVPSEKVSFEFVYESETTPEFGNFLEFSVQKTVTKKTSTTLFVGEHDLRFMAVAISKKYMVDGVEVNEMELDSYRRTEVPTRVAVTGVGTFGVEGISVRDEIPPGFEAPEIVSVTRNGREMGPEEYTYTPSEEALQIEVTNLQETEEGSFGEDSTLVIDYKSIANSPEPREEPLIARGYVEAWLMDNPDIKVRAESEMEGLNLVVVHRRSLVDISRGIYSTEVDGRDGYEIEMDAENAGTASETITVQDLVPMGFSLVESSIKMEPQGETVGSESVTDGLVYGWKFDNVAPGDTVNITYSIIQEDPNASTRKLYTVYKG